ncbi:MAG: SUMF1/EgtB/PvdO family nonheme iron enzyme [bacterium]
MRMYFRLVLLTACCLGPALAAGDLRALLAGISEYPQFGDVPVANASARALAARLRQEAGLDDARLTLLLSDASTPAGRPTLERLRQAITACGRAAKPGDVTLFYFCGHAMSSGMGGDAFLVPLGGLDAGTLSLTWVRDTLQAVPGVTVVLMVDSGHAHTSGRGIASNANELIRPGVFCLAPARADELAYPDDTLGQTVLVVALNWSLAGGGAATPQNPETLGNLFAGVEHFFAAWRARTHLQQQPLLAGTGAERVVLFTRTPVAAGQAGTSGAPLPGQAWQIPNTDLRLLPLAPGTFRMGSDNFEADEAPGHQVTLTKPFWMSQYEVSAVTFRAVLGQPPPPATAVPKLPAEAVSWDDAMLFCALLNEQEDKRVRLPTGYAYRLPTEAEWEYACRAGTTTAFGYGDDPQRLREYANFSYSDPAGFRVLKIQPSGQYKPNAWGLYDLHGNLNEWCLDNFAPYTATAVTDPLVLNGNDQTKAIRGGSWNDDAFRCRSSIRLFATAELATPGLGFRIVLAPILNNQPTVVIKAEREPRQSP